MEPISGKHRRRADEATALLSLAFAFWNGNARDLEPVAGAAVQTSAVHPADQVQLRRVDVAALRILDGLVGDVHAQDAPDHQVAAMRQFNKLV